jgi:5-methylcytosine-specific restriction endonuclease McrA
MGVRKHGAAVYRSQRWAALRQQAKRRDGFVCVKCGARGRLEVDHVKPVRTHPELSFTLENLMTLCPSCHARKTAIEVGFAPLDPERQRWRDLLNERKTNARVCEDSAASV